MRLFKKGDLVFIHHEEMVYQMKTAWDELVNRTGLFRYLKSILPTLPIAVKLEVIVFKFKTVLIILVVKLVVEVVVIELKTP